MGTGGSFPAGKAVGREYGQSPISSAEINECVALYLRHPYIFVAWYLVKHMDNFIFNFYYFRNLIKLKKNIFSFLLLSYCISFTSRIIYEKDFRDSLKYRPFHVFS
jgi:hypothetical protein